MTEQGLRSHRPRAGALAAVVFGLGVGVSAGGCVPLQTGGGGNSGLLEAPNIASETLSPPGDIGFEPMRFPVHQVQLESGLRVAFERAPTRGLVGVVLVVGTGGAVDPPGREGLAHLIEHLAFQAHGPGEMPVAKRLARMGATYNAETDLESTKYYEFAPEEALPALLAVAARRLSDPLAGVDQEDFVLEKQIVMNELRQKNETGVYGQVSDWMHGALFPGHPYGRSVGGSAQSIAAITLDEARAHVARHYRPANASLVIVGGFDLNGTTELIARVFPPELRREPKAVAASASAPARGAKGGASAAGGARQAAVVKQAAAAVKPAAAAVNAAAATPASAAATSPGAAAAVAESVPGLRHAARHDLLAAAVSRPEIWLAWALPDVYGERGAVTRILSAPAVRLAVRSELIEEDDVLDVDITVLEHRQSTVIACQLVLGDTRQRDRIAEKARDAFASLWRSTQGLATAMALGDYSKYEQTVANVQRQAGFQRQAMANAIFATESYVGRATQRADFLYALGRATAYDEATMGLARVPQDSLQQHAAFYFAPGRARVLYLDPLPEQTRPPPGLTGVSLEQRPMEDQPFRAMEFGEPPAPKPVPELTGARWLRLANGMEVAIVPRPQFPVVTAILGFRGGGAAMPAGVFTLVRGLERRSMSFESNAIELHRHDGEDFTADLVRAGARNLSNALVILAARVVSTQRADWMRISGELRSQPAPPWVKDTPLTRASRAFWAALYGANHPYGQVPGWNEIVGVDPNTVGGWIARVRSPRNAILVVVGNVEPNATEALVRRWFEGWVGADPVLPAVAPVPAPTVHAEPKVLVTHRPGATQAEVTIGCRLPPPAKEQAPGAYDLLANVVAGYLSTQLRATGGAAYSVSGDASVWTGGAAHMTVTSAIENRHVPQALKVIRGHWSSFARGEFDAGGLSQARWAAARAQGLAFQTSTDAALWVFEAVRSRRPIDPIGDYRHLLQVGQPELARAFATCANTTVLSLVGDEPTIRAALGTATSNPALVPASAPAPAPAPVRAGRK